YHFVTARAKKRPEHSPRPSLHSIPVNLSLESTLAPGRVQFLLAQTYRARGNLHQLVVSDEFQRLLQGQKTRRSQFDGIVCAGGTHVGQLLALAGVDVQVVVLVVLADDHATIDLDAGTDEKGAAGLKGIQRVG